MKSIVLVLFVEDLKDMSLDDFFTEICIFASWIFCFRLICTVLGQEKTWQFSYIKLMSILSD